MLINTKSHSADNETWRRSLPLIKILKCQADRSKVGSLMRLDLEAVLAIIVLRNSLSRATILFSQNANRNASKGQIIIANFGGFI